MPLPVRILPSQVSTRSSTQGSTLLVVLAIIVVMSVMITLGLGVFKTETPVDRSIETRARLERISHELASYAQNHYRLPCPADPSRDPLEATSGRENALNEVCAANTRYNGIVPYRTLNLSYEDILDAWGNPIAYAISPVFSETDHDTGSTRIASFCRTYGDPSGPGSRDKWIVNIAVSGVDLKNINRRKALFCCPSEDRQPVATDLRILRANGQAIDPSPYNAFNTGGDPVRTTIAADFGDPDTIDATPVSPSSRSPETWAFVLLSYGANGREAGTGTREAINADTSSGDLNRARSFIDAPRNLSVGANYFDDVLLYMTQDQVMGKLNNGSCRTPYFSYQQD